MSLFSHLNRGAPDSRLWPRDWPGVNRAGCKAGDVLIDFDGLVTYLVLEVIEDRRPNDVRARVRVLVGPSKGNVNPAPAAGEEVQMALDERYLLYRGGRLSQDADLSRAEGLHGGLAEEIAEGIKSGQPSIRHRPGYGGAFVGKELVCLRKAGFDVHQTPVDVLVYLPGCCAI